MSYKCENDFPMYVGQVFRNRDLAPTKAFVVQHIEKCVLHNDLIIHGLLIFLATKRITKPEDVSLRFAKSNSENPHAPLSYQYYRRGNRNTLFEDFPFCVSCPVQLPHRTTMKADEDLLRSGVIDPNSEHEKHIKRKELKRNSA